MQQNGLYLIILAGQPAVKLESYYSIATCKDAALFCALEAQCSFFV